MRKLVLIALSVAVAASLAGPAVGGPSVRRDDQGFADWMLPTEKKNEFRWFGAYAMRGTAIVGEGDGFSFAGFVRGRCVRERTPRYVSISCDGEDFIAGDPDRNFEISPAATEGRLRIRRDGRTHVVRWDSGAAPVGSYFMSEYCFSIEPGEEEAEQEGEGHGGGIWNPADATGRIFGQRFDAPARARWSALATGAMVTTCSFRSVDYDPNTGSLHVEFRLPR